MPSRFAVLAGSALLFVAVPSGAEDLPAAMSGQWSLNRKLSQDIEAQIKEAAGSQYISSGPKWTPSETWLPWGRSYKDGERLEVREFLLAVIPVLQNLEVEVSPSEVRTIHGEAGVRIFNVTRKSAGTSAMTGEKVLRQARWEGPQLQLESKGKDSRLTEAITLVPERRQITYALHFEAKMLEKPLDLRLMYDRSTD